jgi:hypothetical protein
MNLSTVYFLDNVYFVHGIVPLVLREHYKFIDDVATAYRDTSV